MVELRVFARRDHAAHRDEFLNGIHDRVQELVRMKPYYFAPRHIDWSTYGKPLPVPKLTDICLS